MAPYASGSACLSLEHTFVWDSWSILQACCGDTSFFEATATR